MEYRPIASISTSWGTVNSQISTRQIQRFMSPSGAKCFHQSCMRILGVTEKSGLSLTDLRHDCYTIACRSMHRGVFLSGELEVTIYGMPELCWLTTRGEKLQNWQVRQMFIFIVIVKASKTTKWLHKDVGLDGRSRRAQCTREYSCVTRFVFASRGMERWIIDEKVPVWLGFIADAPLGIVKQNSLRTKPTLAITCSKQRINLGT